MSSRERRCGVESVREEVDPFSLAYEQARVKFLEAARARNAEVQSFTHPLHKGPVGEDLAVDVAVLGSDRNGRVLVIVSGTHGVEGHAGSACQIDLLRSDYLTAMMTSTQVVLVHAINPYGFAYPVGQES